jgi:hypothetical protein
MCLQPAASPRNLTAPGKVGDVVQRHHGHDGVHLEVGNLVAAEIEIQHLRSRQDSVVHLALR